MEPMAAQDLTSRDARRRWRSLKDRVARRAVAVGGVGVIVAIVLIFFYLLYVVLPLFEVPEMRRAGEYAMPGPAAETLHLSVEESGVLVARYAADGSVSFFEPRTGELREVLHLPLHGAAVTAFAPIEPARNLMAFGLSDGRVLVVRHDYRVSYPDNSRTLDPYLEFPLGEAPLQLDEQGRAVRGVTARYDDNGAVLAGVLDGGVTVVARYGLRTSFLTGERSLEPEGRWELTEQLPGGEAPRWLLINPQQSWLYVAGVSGNLMLFELAVRDPQLLQRVRLTGPGERLTALRFLVGGTSLLAGSSEGRVSQWFAVREEGGQHRLVRVRGFDALDGSVTDIAPEERRKGFAAATETGEIGLFHTTSEQVLLTRRLDGFRPQGLVLAPRGNQLLLRDDGRVLRWEVENEHPEISWSALWGQVWYESYDEPRFIWQSTAATNDFEPKFSLVPLAFGTLKAAFYAMLFAVPLALMGAIYTAYFMAPRLRRMVKPTIEIMSALPTVILGFLGGLWLAPLIEKHLAGVLLVLFSLPVAMLAFGFLWHKLPERLRLAVPEGWHAALLAPVLALVAWGMYALGAPLEANVFDGNLPQWLANQAGIPFDQRNALVVGIAMGFAVIPVIFSIAEDAIFEVPKHLTYGSLALGATPWQTMVRVVLPTASPGIFSALMIGLGRAVGETMIVLMATGNTPVLTMNIFEGLRTLSANIAVEMPESEVGSSHYRVLFLAALVLFMFTFVLNTVAEIVRQRLRNKYSNL